MDVVTAVLIAGLAPLFLDILGHVINGAKLRVALRRLDEAEARGVHVAQQVDAMASAMAAVLDVLGLVYDEEQKKYVQRAPPTLNGGGDPHDARAAREEHADADAAAEERIRATFVNKLGEELGELAFNTAKKNKTTWKRAVRALASGKLDVAQSILGPTAERFSVKVDGGARASSSTGSSQLPF